MGKGKEMNYLNFKVCSIHTNFKMMHSLHWIYTRTGAEIEEVIMRISKDLLNYINHVVNREKAEVHHTILSSMILIGCKAGMGAKWLEEMLSRTLLSNRLMNMKDLTRLEKMLLESKHVLSVVKNCQRIPNKLISGMRKLIMSFQPFLDSECPYLIDHLQHIKYYLEMYPNSLLE